MQHTRSTPRPRMPYVPHQPHCAARSAHILSRQPHKLHGPKGKTNRRHRASWSHTLRGQMMRCHAALTTHQALPPQQQLRPDSRDALPQGHLMNRQCFARLQCGTSRQQVRSCILLEQNSVAQQAAAAQRVCAAARRPPSQTALVRLPLRASFSAPQGCAVVSCV